MSDGPQRTVLFHSRGEGTGTAKWARGVLAPWGRSHWMALNHVSLRAQRRRSEALSSAPPGTADLAPGPSSDRQMPPPPFSKRRQRAITPTQ